MAFVTRFRLAPATLTLMVAFICGVCVIGCGSEADTSGANEVAPSGESPGSGSETEEGSKPGSGSESEE